MTAIKGLGSVVILQVCLVQAYDTEGLAKGIVNSDVVVPLLANPAQLQRIVIGRQIMIGYANHLVNWKWAVYVFSTVVQLGWVLRNIRLVEPTGRNDVGVGSHAVLVQLIFAVATNVRCFEERGEERQPLRDTETIARGQRALIVRTAYSTGVKRLRSSSSSHDLRKCHKRSEPRILNA